MLQLSSEITLDRTSQNRIVSEVPSTFWSYDIRIAKKFVNFKFMGETLDLTNAINVIFAFHFVNAGATRYLMSSANDRVRIVDAENGRVSIRIPNYEHEYTGPVAIYAFVDMIDEQHIDYGIFNTSFQESFIHTELPELERFSFESLEMLERATRERAEEIRIELENEFINVRQDVDQAFIDLQSATDTHQNTLSQSTQLGIDSIERTSSDGVSMIESKRDSSLNSINQTTSSGINQVENVTDDGVNQINSTTSQGQTAVNATRDSAIESVNQTRDGAITQINTREGQVIDRIQGSMDELDSLHETIGNLTEQSDRLSMEADRISGQIVDGNIVTQNDFDELVQDVNGIASVEHVTDTSWMTVSESREGKLTDINVEGRTLVNLWSDNRDDFVQLDVPVALADDGVLSVTTTSARYGMNARLNAAMFKPSTTYTFVVDVLRLDTGLTFQLQQFSAFLIGAPNTMSSIGRFVFTRTSVTSMTANMQVGTGFGNPNLIVGLQGEVRISIFEGDLTNLNLSHTPPRTLHNVGDGVEEISVTSVGENLFDGELERGTIGTVSGANIGHQSHARTLGFVKVQGGRNVFGWTEAHSSNNGFNNIYEYDSNFNFLRFSTTWMHNQWTLLPNTAYIRGVIVAPTGTDPIPLNSRGTITFDRRVTEPIPHTSTTQPLTYQDVDGNWLPIPYLKGIMDGAETLVADSVEEINGELVYVQRVAEVDLESIPSIPPPVDIRENTSVWIFATPVWTNQISNAVTSNKIPTHPTSVWGQDRVLVNLRDDGRIQIRLPNSLGFTTGAQVRQYLIDNDYQFLVPLAEPITRPVRPINIPSHNPVTNIRIDSGTVSPRFSFKIATSLGQRLRLAENKIRDLETKVWDAIQTVARALVQPVEFRNYRDVAEIGFPEEFEECEVIKQTECKCIEQE